MRFHARFQGCSTNSPLLLPRGSSKLAPGMFFSRPITNPAKRSPEVWQIPPLEVGHNLLYEKGVSHGHAPVISNYPPQTFISIYHIHPTIHSPTHRSIYLIDLSIYPIQSYYPSIYLSIFLSIYPNSPLPEFNLFRAPPLIAGSICEVGGSMSTCIYIPKKWLVSSPNFMVKLSEWNQQPMVIRIIYWHNVKYNVYIYIYVCVRVCACKYDRLLVISPRCPICPAQYSR